MCGVVTSRPQALVRHVNVILTHLLIPVQLSGEFVSRLQSQCELRVLRTRNKFAAESFVYVRTL